MPRLTDTRKLAAKGRGSAPVNALVVTELIPSIDWPETGLEDINGHVPEADFWPATTCVLPVILNGLGGFRDQQLRSCLLKKYNLSAKKTARSASGSL